MLPLIPDNKAKDFTMDVFEADRAYKANIEANEEYDRKQKTMTAEEKRGSIMTIPPKYDSFDDYVKKYMPAFAEVSHGDVVLTGYEPKVIRVKANYQPLKFYSRITKEK